MSAGLPRVLELMATVDWVAVGRFLATAAPIWILGFAMGGIGVLLLRPGHRTAATLLATAEAGARLSMFGRLAFLFQGLMLLRELWLRYTAPGTFHRIVANISQFFKGRGHPLAEQPMADSEKVAEEAESEWCVGEQDLAFFIERTQGDDGNGAWETMLEKDLAGSLKYHAWRRMLPSRKTEYKSVTITADASPREVMDFYLNDPVRQRWDPMLTHTETLLDGKFSERQQVVHWVRSFPFSFLSDRDYVIGRRVFERGDMLYGISKAVPFPSHSPGRLVSCTTYWSMWSHRRVPCPWNSGRAATETVLLHMEDFKIPENLSRFAVRHGMWGFVQKMAPACTAFIAERRAAGVAPDDKDPHAFGAPAEGSVHPPPRKVSFDMRHAHSTSDLTAEKSAPSAMKRVASAVVAGSMLIALGGLGQHHMEAISRRRSRRSFDQLRRATLHEVPERAVQSFPLNDIASPARASPQSSRRLD